MCVLSTQALMPHDGKTFGNILLNVYRGRVEKHHFNAPGRVTDSTLVIGEYHPPPRDKEATSTWDLCFLSPPLQTITPVYLFACMHVICANRKVGSMSTSSCIFLSLMIECFIKENSSKFFSHVNFIEKRLICF